MIKRHCKGTIKCLMYLSIYPIHNYGLFLYCMCKTKKDIWWKTGTDRVKNNASVVYSERLFFFFEFFITTDILPTHNEPNENYCYQGRTEVMPEIILN